MAHARMRVLSRGNQKPVVLALTNYYDDDNAETKTLVNAWVAGAVAAPSINRRYVIDHFIGRVKAAGGWSGVMCVPLCHATGAKATNWINPGTLDFLVQGGAVFTVDSGVQLNGTSGYFEVNALLSAIPGWAQDNAAVHYAITGAAATGTEMGGVSGTRTTTLLPKNGTSNVLARINNTSTVTLGVNATRNALFGLQRVNSLGFTFSVNGAVAFPGVATSVPPANQTQHPTFGRDNTTYSDGNLQFMRMGPAVDEALLYAAWSAYKANIAAADAREAGYTYSLMKTAGGLYPTSFMWGSVNAYVSGGGIDFPGLRHSVRQSSDGAKMRLEIKNTTEDRRKADLPSTRKRSELGFNDTLIPRGIEYWFAFTVMPEAFAKPASMLETATLSGHLCQVKGDDDGSASIGIRRTNNDQIAVTTVGGTDNSQGATRYNQPWTRGVPHDFVCRVILHETAGEVEIHMDGTQIVNEVGIPTAPTPYGIGAYIKLGPYHSGGIGSDPDSTVVNWYANYTPPQTGSLASRRSSPPAW